MQVPINQDNKATEQKNKPKGGNRRKESDALRQLTQKKAMVEALEKSLGIVTTACKIVGIARVTHYDWLEHDAEYKKACMSIDDIALDFAESSLHKQISGGNAVSTIFYLKTKGKKRGYIERQEMDITGSSPFTILLTEAPEKESDER